MKEILNDLFILTFFLFLASFCVLNIYSISGEEDDFFGIFPEDYYDPGDYGPESSSPEQLNDDETTPIESPTHDNFGKSTNIPSEKENNNINFIAAGDWNCNEETKKTIKRITQLQPELVLGLGDYTLENISPQCWFDISKPLDDIIRIAIGNHDLDYQSSYYQLLDHYNLYKPYYSFNFQNIHFVTISTDHPFEKGSIQYDFLQYDLEKSLHDSSILWRIVFLHKPLYTASDFDEKASEELKTTFHKLFEEYHVDLVLSGHTQYYQRSLPLSYNNDNPSYPVVMDKINSDYRDNQGIIFLTAGTAGDELHKIDYILPYYVIQERYFGFLNFDLRNDGQTLVGTFYDTENLGIVDKFEVSKGRIGEKIYSEENSQKEYNNKYFSYPEEKSWIFNNRIHLTGNQAEYDKLPVDS
jgi:calcineurin-like phosphoesterase family protein